MELNSEERLCDLIDYLCGKIKYILYTHRRYCPKDHI